MAFRVTRRRIIKRDVTQELAVPVSSKTRREDVGPNIRSLALKDVSKRIDPTVSKSQLELLKRIDGLTFRIVQKYIENIIGESYVLKGGSDQGRETCEEFCRRIDIRFLTSLIVDDIFATGAGNAWTELGYNQTGTNILTVTVINPKSGIDFIRNQDKDIIYDKTLNPVGFHLGGNLGYPKMEWQENFIKVDNETKWTPSKSGEDGRDRVAHWKFVGSGDELGISPLEPTYKAAVIRLNLEDTVGNAAFRSLAVAALVGTEGENPMNVTDEQLNSVRDKLRDLDQDTVWAFRYNVKLVDLPIPDISNYSELMYYFADMEAAGAGVGLALILAPMERGYRGDIADKREDFMDSVKHFQEILSYHIRENLFKRLLKAKGQRPDNAPDIVFITKDSGIALSKSRRLSTYARYELLTPDPDLEEWLRQQEGLPPLDEVIKKIKYSPKTEKEETPQPESTENE